jgi:pimeloyl-ACP methyl ester carboxylesterase
MEGEDLQATEQWLSREALGVYVGEWQRTGFQGALNWYRAQTASTPQSAKDMFLFAGRRIEVPVAFISGKQDWGNFQQPGALESYEDDTCVKSGCFRGSTLIDNAGHWVQQEQSGRVIDAITKFLKTL